MSDGNYAFYIINSIWVEKWKNFVKYKHSPAPGPITN